MPAANSSIYEFGEFQIDVGKRLLFKGGSENLALTPKVFDTLLYLLERPGEVVGKDELLAAVWPDTIVEENNLSQNISVLRRVLGEKRTEHRFIVTIPGRGYKFVAEVREVPATDGRAGQGNLHAELAPSSHLDVERRGNVLALVDWNQNTGEAEPSNLAGLGHPEAAKAAPALPKVRAVAIAGLVLAVAAVSAFAFFWFNNWLNVPAAESRVLDVTRLTNGFFPYSAAISPDGKYFVYHEIDGGLQRMLLQQTGHAIRFEILTTSEHELSAKSFTPDGQFVYYLATEKGGESPSLFRIRAFGGNPTKVLTDINSYVSFSPDGSRMVFGRYDESLRELQYVIKSSDGGEDQAILFRRGMPQRLGGTAAWSPDGKTVIVDSSVVSDDGRYRCTLAAIPADGGEPVPVSEGWGTCYRIEWRRDGAGFYVLATREDDAQSSRRDQVYYVSYPDGRFERITTEDSRHQIFSLGATVDGSVLAAPFNRSSQIWVMNADGDTRSAVQITSGNADGRAGIAALASGGIAFLARTGENLNIWSVNQDGSDLKQVNSDPRFVEELRSSVGAPQTLVFSAPQGDFLHLFRINTDGTDIRQLTFGDSFEVDSSISNDGRWVVFTRTVITGMQHAVDLRKVPIEGGESIQFYDKPCSSPLFSPDDRLVSCVQADRNIQILSAHDGGLVGSFPALPLSVINFGAVWAPDGKSIVYIVNEKDDISNLWQHPIDGRPPKRLTNFTTGTIYRFAYSFDGKRLFLARGQQIRDALLIKHVLR